MGSVMGSVVGSVMGPVVGFVMGPVAGFVMGPVVGFVMGSVVGSVMGFVMGFVMGPVIVPDAVPVVGPVIDPMVDPVVGIVAVPVFLRDRPHAANPQRKAIAPQSARRQLALMAGCSEAFDPGNGRFAGHGFSRQAQAEPLRRDGMPILAPSVTDVTPGDSCPTRQFVGHPGGVHPRLAKQ